MKSLNEYLPTIINSIAQINPERIILFGSLVSNTINENSDIDLVVILDSDSLPKTFDEKLKNKTFVRNTILDLSFEIPIDLVVYTRKEFQELQKLENPFLKEIQNNGRVIYEKVS